MRIAKAFLKALAVGATLGVCGTLVGLSGGCQKKDDAPRASGVAPTPGAVAPAALPPSPSPSPSPAPAMPPPSAPEAAPAAAGPGGTIVGKITLAPARKGDVSPNDMIFLTARRIPDSPGTRGSLVAVKRFTAASFPIAFTLGAADMMFKNGEFTGDLTLAARVDKDGDPLTRRKGDVFATLDKVTVGAKNVELRLSELQKEDESLLGGGGPPAGPAAGGALPPGHP